MSTQPSHDTQAKSGPKGVARRLVTGIFMLLALGFLLRFCQNAYHWLAGHSSVDANYKALTVWCLLYVLICSGFAWLAHGWSGQCDSTRTE